MVSNCFMPIGTGLILTLATRTGSGTWIGCLVPLGFGLGIGLSHGPIAVQTLLPHKDIPMVIALVFFCQQFKGDTLVSAGGKVLNTKLIAGITGFIGKLDLQKIINAGAT
ncbi:hypothetical protein G3M48_003045 [Beauveria asiatica]|uniref:Uncharacterized protein n=1 Tax=Beauveria asiatica TaxID=1069075 RepID=A0AAW0RWV0_9HYPO